MVLPQFQNLDIQCWEFSGRLGMNRPFICLQGGSAACEIVLAAVDELSAERPPAKRTLALKMVAHPMGCSKIRLVLSPESDDIGEMCLTRSLDTAVFEFTLAGLAKFRHAVQWWRDGGEDFSVHPARNSDAAKDKRSGEVWFWTPLMDP